MSKLTRQEMLTLALGVLPAPPAEVEVLSARHRVLDDDDLE